MHALTSHRQCLDGEGRVGGCYHGCPWEVEKEAREVLASWAWQAQSPGYTIKSLYLFGEGVKEGGDKVGTTSSTSGGEFKEIALKAEFKVPETSVAGGVKGVFGVAGSGVPIVSDSSSLIREWINGANWKGFRVDVLCRLAKGLMPGDFSEYSVFLGNFLGCFSPRGSKSKDLLYK